MLGMLSAKQPTWGLNVGSPPSDSQLPRKNRQKLRVFPDKFAENAWLSFAHQVIRSRSTLSESPSIFSGQVQSKQPLQKRRHLQMKAPRTKAREQILA
jgi:hypothetical protein